MESPVSSKRRYAAGSISTPILALAVCAVTVAALGCGKETTQAGARSCESVLDCPPGWQCDKDLGQCVAPSDASIVDSRVSDGRVDAAEDGGRDGQVDAAEVDGAVDGSFPDAAPGDAGPATCLYVPDPGQFTPTMECRWDSPVQYSGYDDVVMAPVVANVTDDNMDGVVDTDDVPDILFSSYRYEQDGCCARQAVLRVVSGRCSTDATHLEEHFHLTDPFLDNSGGIAVGDIDADGSP
jgi:hypothetical protein